MSDPPWLKGSIGNTPVYLSGKSCISEWPCMITLYREMNTQVMAMLMTTTKFYKSMMEMQCIFLVMESDR